jgi:hypothetical protein
MKASIPMTTVLIVGLAGSAQGLFIDFDGLNTGVGLAGQTSSAVDGDGVSLADPTWQDGGGDGTVVDGDLGTAMSETSSSPYYLHGGSFTKGIYLNVSGLDAAGGFWMSTLFQVSAVVPGSSGHFGTVALYEGGSEKLNMGTETFNFADNQYRLTGGAIDSSKTPDNGISSGVAVDADTHLLAMQYDPSDTGNELKIWVDPDFSALATAPDASGPAFAAELANIDSLALRGGGSAVALLDNIYLGNNSPFIPEPASLALVGLGGLCLLARRKRA